MKDIEMSEKEKTAIYYQRKSIIPQRCYVYEIRCLTTKKVYVGRATCITLRMKAHFSMREKHKFNDDMVKYGIDDFNIRIVAVCDNILMSKIIERFLMTKYTQLGLSYNKIVASNTTSAYNMWEIIQKYGMERVESIAKEWCKKDFQPTTHYVCDHCVFNLNQQSCIGAIENGVILL